jgi:hypothetical protein
MSDPGDLPIKTNGRDDCERPSSFTSPAFSIRTPSGYRMYLQPGGSIGWSAHPPVSIHHHKTQDQGTPSTKTIGTSSGKSAASPEHTLNEKVDALCKAEANWATLPEKWQDIMSSKFFRLHYRWRFMQDQDALEELKSLAEIESNIKDHYLRHDFWPYIVLSHKDVETGEKALKAAEELERAQDDMPKGYFDIPSTDRMNNQGDTVDKEAMDDDWVDLSAEIYDRPLPLVRNNQANPEDVIKKYQNLTGDGCTLSNSPLRDEQNEFIVITNQEYEEDRALWRARQEQAIEEDKRRMAEDNSKARDIHNEFMKPEWRAVREPTAKEREMMTGL